MDSKHHRTRARVIRPGPGIAAGLALTLALTAGLFAQLVPDTARGKAPQALPALRAYPAPADRPLPGWPRPTVPAQRVAPGAEAVVMLPAEQHMGEFSDADLSFVRRAAMANEAQVAYAKLALRRAKAADVRAMGQRLFSFHRKARVDLANVVQSQGVVLPAGLGTAHQWLRAHLMEADDKTFDRLYLRAQIDEHLTEINALREQVNHGKSARLRAWARAVLGGMEEHRRALESLYSPKPVS